MSHAVVVGSGPNGLVGAIVLAEAGLDVEVLEASEGIGGGLRTEALTLPGYRHDVCAAIMPFAAASPAFAELGIEVDWIETEAVAAHPFDDGTALVLRRDVGATAEQLGPDADAYRKLIGPLVDAWEAVASVLLGPYPLRPATVVRVARRLGLSGFTTGARATFAAAEPLAQTFETPKAQAFLAGHAAHSVLPLDRRPSGAFALGLVVLGHSVGWPFPRGGSQQIADRLAARLRELGGELRPGSAAEVLPEADVVLADTSPWELLRLAGGRLPSRYARALRGFRRGPGVFKLDWALSEPIPWTAPECQGAATIHLGGTLAEIAESERSVWEGRLTERPFVLLAQPSLFDPTRAPTGKHTAWAYCHVPNGCTADLTSVVEAQVERFAPGFRDVIEARSVLDPAGLEAHNRNLVGGDITGGPLDVRGLMRRALPWPVPYRTPIPGVYLCSAYTPPGGGVHGMSGYAAAKLALAGAGV